jgi:hypothetical protein
MKHPVVFANALSVMVSERIDTQKVPSKHYRNFSKKIRATFRTKKILHGNEKLNLQQLSNYA